jgi:hypothetical protein
VKYLEKNFHEIGMWCIALLVNTNDWKEFHANWDLICQTFCCWHMGTPTHMNSHYDLLLNKINNIKGNPNISASINTTRNDSSIENDVFTFSEDQDESFDENPQLSHIHNVDRIQLSISRVSYRNL